jgi:hypothetical protein
LPTGQPYAHRDPISAALTTCNPGGRRKSAAQASTREAGFDASLGASLVASNVSGDGGNDSGVLPSDSGDMSLACPMNFCGTFK